jgi:outer membrane protein insertion porin family
MKLKAFYFIIISLISNFSISYSESLIFKGLDKLNISDLQSLTSINLYNEKISDTEIDIIIKDLYSSNLIFDVSYNETQNNKIITVEESKIIENIFFNGNVVFKNEDLLNFINIKTGNFVNKDNITLSTNILKNIYSSRGFDNITINISLEKYSSNRVNLIYYINEGTRSQISRIKFVGNNFFTNRYLKNKIKSKSVNFYNIFSKGSNLNKELLDFDVNSIKQLYEDNSFFDIDISHELRKLSKNNYSLIFYIDEGDRYLIDDVMLDLPSLLILNSFDDLSNSFINEFNNNENFFNFQSTTEFTQKLNNLLISNNILDIEILTKLLESDNKLYLSFYENPIIPKTIQGIDIFGNSITKDIVIRSKINVEPGDYLNSNTISQIKKDINNLRYVNKVNISENIDDKNRSNITLDIEENKKTGNILAAASASGDTGIGFSFGINDYNFMGTGNKLDSSFNINSEQTKFSIDYTQFLLSNSKITNRYSIFNQEKDFSNSYGYKSTDIGLGYSLGFQYSDNISVSSGVTISNVDGSSAINSSTQVTDNIGNFEQYIFNLNLKYDSTNDFLYPTNGAYNKISIDYSPNDLSDYGYLKFKIDNDIYFGNNKSNSFFFISNNLGVADAFDDNLKTLNTFSLGGLNFKGFDYRGIGTKKDGVYLGGNKYYTSTLGYGSSFLFDESDNINFRLFYTMGSIWDSDYLSDDNSYTRSSVGLSFDILTPVFPISFSFAVPVNKKDNDRTREFSFNLGTSF